MRRPRTETAKKLLRKTYLHDPSCFSHQGMDCGRCSLPGILRDIEDESISPFVSFIDYVEDRTKPMSVFMSGDTGGHAASRLRSKELWNKANAILNRLDEDDHVSGACLCGLGVFEHKPESIRFCHLGYHTVGCVKGADHA